MKPFSLETVLNYRQRLEDIAHNRFFQAEQNKALIKQKLNQEQIKLGQLIKKSTQLQAQGVTITELIRYETSILQNEENIIAIKKNLDEKTMLMHKERENLIQRSRDRQIMERLKEQQNLAWKEYLNKKEAAMLDEIAIIRHGGEN